MSFGFFAKLGVLNTALVVFAIVLADFFGTLGSLIGVGEQAGYLDERGQLPEAQKPLLVDSLPAVAGGAAGSSSATTSIESAAGVGVGGRTGLTAVVTGILFLLAMPFWPIVSMVPTQATAPAPRHGGAPSNGSTVRCPARRYLPSPDPLDPDTVDGTSLHRATPRRLADGPGGGYDGAVPGSAWRCRGRHALSRPRSEER